MGAQATWLAYPEAAQLALANPWGAVERLHEAGVSLLVLRGGVIAATGPAGWFTEGNRLALRQRAAALADYLERAGS